MNKRFSSSGNTFRFLAGALTLAALFSLGNPGRSEATGTTANAKIVNQVVVTFKDATGLGTLYTQKADVTVTVLLQKSDLTIAALGNQTVASGATASYTNYAITSNTNGSDNYKIINTLSSPSNLGSTESSTFTIWKLNGSGVLAATGMTDTANNGSPAKTLSSVPIGGAIATGSPASDQLTFPGGTINGNIAVNALVMVAGYGGPFRVSAITDGAAPKIDSGTGNYTAETPDTITLVAYGTSGDPAFDSGVRGAVVAERVFLKVTVTGTVSGNSNGSVVHTITSSASDDTHPAGTQTNTTTFQASSLSITKSAFDCGPYTSMTACAAPTGGNIIPGHVIEYRITVHNGGDASATLVTVADAVPSYTTLLEYATSGAAVPITATKNFAKVTTGSTGDAPLDLNINITATKITDTNEYGSGSGTAFGKITLVGGKPIEYERNTLTFWIGASSALNATTGVGTGGTLATGSSSTPDNAPTYTIKYRVQVN